MGIEVMIRFFPEPLVKGFVSFLSTCPALLRTGHQRHFSC